MAIKTQTMELDGKEVRMFSPEDTNLIKWQLDVLGIMDNIAFAKEKGEKQFASFEIDSKKLSKIKRYGYELINTLETEEFIAKNGKSYTRYIYRIKRI